MHNALQIKCSFRLKTQTKCYNVGVIVLERYKTRKMAKILSSKAR
jgi:hypothetical protein